LGPKGNERWGQNKSTVAALRAFCNLLITDHSPQFYIFQTSMIYPGYYWLELLVEMKNRTLAVLILKTIYQKAKSGTDKPE
jgi:hypothetical protein